MPIIRSSRVLYKRLLPVVFGALVFKLSVWCVAEGYVSGLRAAASRRCTVKITSNLGFTSKGLAAFVGYKGEPNRQRTAVALPVWSRVNLMADQEVKKPPERKLTTYVQVQRSRMRVPVEVVH